MNTPKIEIPQSKEKILRQIEALNCLLKTDKDDFSREVHQQALQDLQRALL